MIHEKAAAIIAVLLTVMAGCGSSPRKTSPPPKPQAAVVVSATATVPAPAAKADERSAVDKACDELRAEHMQVVSGSPFEDMTFTADSLNELAEERGDAPLEPGAFATCTKTPHGAWALAITEVGQDAPFDMACVALVHIDDQGRRQHAFPWRGAGGKCSAGNDLDANYVLGLTGFVTLAKPQLFDYDADGEPEGFIARRGLHYGSYVRGNDMLWTFRNGVVEPYPAALGIGIVELRDVDSDGRPDLITYGPYHGFIVFKCGLHSGYPNPFNGPKLMVHALPDGSFSHDDEAARAYALRGCAKPPAVVDTDIDMACAFLWGRDKGWIGRSLKSCRRDCGGIDPCCPEWCEQDRKTASEWAKDKPPLRLDKKRK